MTHITCIFLWNVASFLKESSLTPHRSVHLAPRNSWELVTELNSRQKLTTGKKRNQTSCRRLWTVCISEGKQSIYSAFLWLQMWPGHASRAPQLGANAARQNGWQGEHNFGMWRHWEIMRENTKPACHERGGGELNKAPLSKDSVSVEVPQQLTYVCNRYDK